MNTRGSRTLAIAATVAAAIFAGANANAQPPAQGPAQPSQNAFTLQAYAFTSMLVASTNQAVASANANLAKSNSYHATIHWSLDTWNPYMLPTQYKDRPNEFYVNKPYGLNFSVDNISVNEGGVWIPYPFSRTIGQSIYVQVFCEGWQNGAGALTYKVVFLPATLDTDHSILEDFLGGDFIPNYVDSQIQGALTGFPTGTQVTSTSQACYSLGVPTPSADAYLVDLQPLARQVAVANELAKSQISARVTQVTRLTLHSPNGVLYESLETPHLDFWAGWSLIHLDLPPMVEGQTYIPPNALVQTPVPASGQLVLIADMTYEGLTAEDSSWAAIGQSSNYGNGTQSMFTPKSWWQPALNGGKPIQLIGNGYQVTVQITGPSLANVALAPANPVSPTPVNPVVSATGVVTLHN